MKEVGEHRKEWWHELRDVEQAGWKMGEHVVNNFRPTITVQVNRGREV